MKFIKCENDEYINTDKISYFTFDKGGTVFAYLQRTVRGESVEVELIVKNCETKENAKIYLSELIDKININCNEVSNDKM